MFRDIVVTLLVLGSLPACFRRPFFGLVVFSWLAYMRVQDLCWGFAKTMRFSYFVAIAMFAGFFLFEQIPFFKRDLRNALMGALAVFVTLSTFLTPYGVDEYVTNYYLEFLKIILVAVFTVAIVNTKERLRVLCWTIALSLGFFGFKSGLWGVATGGAKQIIRGPGGLMADNNDFSLALTMNLPFLFYLGLSESNKWVKRGLMLTMGLTCVTILLTHSRGGFLAMAASLGLMTWRSRNRFIGIALAIVAALMFVAFAPAGVKERISSIKSYDADSSAQARLRTWGIALEMIQANPILGVGFRNFQTAYGDYDPDPTIVRGKRSSYVAHNSYLQISAESGIPALACYLGIFGSSLFLLRRVRRAALARFNTGWILNYVRMFEASLFGFLVGAMFLNRGHFDFAYHLVAIVVAFAGIAFAELTSDQLYPERARAVASVRPAAGFGFGLAPSGTVSLGSGGSVVARPTPPPDSGRPRFGFGAWIPTLPGFRKR